MKFKKIGVTIMLSFTTSLLTVGCTNENEISHETVDQVKVDDIKESIALGTDLKTWANASAWSLEGDSSVEITEVVYDFDPENITEGDYSVTFKTEGYQYKVDTTDEFEEGQVIGLMFEPEDIHIMKKQGGR